MEDTRVEEVRENFTLRKIQERVWRLESENKELKVNNSILQTQYTSQVETQSDILRTLHANLEENYTKIEMSDEKIQKLEQQLEDQKQGFKDKLAEERAQWENRMAGLQVQNEDLEHKLHEVREFQRNKEVMEAELAALKRQLQDQEEAHARDTSNLDRKKAIEIDQLKKDMHKSIQTTRDMLKARTKDQLDSTTKRTIMENEQMATELHFQSKETERLLDRNQALLEENAQLRRNLLIHKDLENELARRTHVYQKLLKKMDQKQKADQASSERSRELRGGSSESTLEEEHSLQAGTSGELKISGSSEQVETLQRQLEGVQSTLQMVRHEFAQYRRDHATLTQLQDQSTRLIIAALYELKNQRECDPFPPASYDEKANWQFVTMTARQKEYFFRVLLEKLNGSMCASCFPTGPAGPQLAQQGSASSLPALAGKVSQAQGEASHFSQFLWSVATHSGQPPLYGSSKKEVAHKGAQTETVASDPCYKEGLWNPHTRFKHTDALSLTPAAVSGAVRTWGPRSTSQRPRVTVSRLV